MTAVEERVIYRHGSDRDFTWEEYIAMVNELSDAMSDGDEETVQRLNPILPIDPEIAKIFKEVFGKEYLLDSGVDLTEANLIYGEGWLDEPNER